jgi:hypothetical protein
MFPDYEIPPQTRQERRRNRQRGHGM